MRRRRNGQRRLRFDRSGNVPRRIIAGRDTARGQPVAQLVIVGRNREDHAHLELLALRFVARNNRLQHRSADRMLRFPIRIFLETGFNLIPDLVGQRDRIAIEVERERRDQFGLGAVADGRGQWLSGEHMRAVQLTTNHPVQQHFPVRLRFQSDIQTFFGEKPLFLGNRQRGHIGELDEPEFQGRLFNRAIHRRHVRRLITVRRSASASGQ